MASHNRDHIWPAGMGDIRVRHMTHEHLVATIAHVRYSLDSPQRENMDKYETYLKVMEAELLWRDDHP